ncbi:MAG: glycerophosphodiester phosphodiesterase family protein, partial [Planctomycetaceae bacterium]
MQLMCVTVMTLTLAAGGRPEIISHRGESADAPENTMAAFRLSWERNVPAIELDVHLTTDDQLVVIHDANTERTCGVKKVIKNSTYADLQDLDAGRWKGAEFAGEHLPLLQDVLAALPNGKRCVIEVKVGPESVPALVRAVEASGKPSEQLMVISFKDQTIAEVRRKLPELQAYWLTSFESDKSTGKVTPTVEQIVARAHEIKAQGVNVSYKGPIDQTFVDAVHNAGLKLYVWTVDDL